MKNKYESEIRLYEGCSDVISECLPSRDFAPAPVRWDRTILDIGLNFPHSLAMHTRLSSWGFLLGLMATNAMAAPACPRPQFAPIPSGREAKAIDVSTLPAILKTNGSGMVNEAQMIPVVSPSKVAVPSGKQVFYLRACTSPTNDAIPRCSIDLAVVHQPPKGEATLVKRVTLAEGEVIRGDEMYELGQLYLTDVDGDGQPEIEVRWFVQGESFPAVGHQTDSFLGIFRPADLSELWSARIGASGAGGLEDCESHLTRADVNCDGHHELHLVSDCIMAICRKDPDPDCGLPTMKVSLFPWNQKARRWTKGTTATQIHDKKLHAVILGSYAMLSKAAQITATKTLKAVHSAGFKDAQLLPGFTFNGLACCFNTLVAGRFETRKAGLEHLEQLKAKGFKGYVKQAIKPQKSIAD